MTEGAAREAWRHGAFDLVRVGRVGVAGGGDEQQRPRRDQADDVVEVGHGPDARDHRGELDRRAIGDPAPVGARAAARRDEPHALVEGGVEEGGRAAVGVAGQADRGGVDAGVPGQGRERGERVAQHRRHQQPAADEPERELVGVAAGVVVARVRARAGRAAVLEAGGVGGEDDQTAAREVRAERLQGVARTARDLALAQVPLAVVLVVDDHAGGRRTVAGAVGHEQVRGHVALCAREAHALLGVAVARLRGEDLDRRRRSGRLRAEQARQPRAQVAGRHPG